MPHVDRLPPDGGEQEYSSFDDPPSSPPRTATIVPFPKPKAKAPSGAVKAPRAAKDPPKPPASRIERGSQAWHQGFSYNAIHLWGKDLERRIKKSADPLPLDLVGELASFKAAGACRKDYGLFGDTEDAIYEGWARVQQVINDPVRLAKYNPARGPIGGWFYKIAYKAIVGAVITENSRGPKKAAKYLVRPTEHVTLEATDFGLKHSHVDAETLDLIPSIAIWDSPDIQEAIDKSQERSASSPEIEAARNAWLEKIFTRARELGRITARQEDAIRKVWLEGMTQKELATEYGCSQVAISKRIAKGIEALQQTAKDLDGDLRTIFYKA